MIIGVVVPALTLYLTSLAFQDPPRQTFQIVKRTQASFLATPVK